MRGLKFPVKLALMGTTIIAPRLLFTAIFVRDSQVRDGEPSLDAEIEQAVAASRQALAGLQAAVDEGGGTADLAPDGRIRSEQRTRLDRRRDRES
jgi:hypothetical protein